MNRILKSLVIIFGIFFFIIPSSVFAQEGPCIKGVSPNYCTNNGSFSHKCKGSCGFEYEVYQCLNNCAQYQYNEVLSPDQVSEKRAPDSCARPCSGSETGTQDSLKRTFGEIPVPDPIKRIGFGAGGISNFLSTLITLIYIFASLIFIFMIVWGAFQWIVSGGDKEAVANARKRITHAIIGIFILALSFVIIGIIGYVTGFEFFRGQEAGFRFQQRQSELEKMRQEFKNAPESAE